MQSRFLEHKGKATILRKQGNSIGSIETALGIPRSTLSGWFREIKLTDIQKNELNLRWKQGLVIARKGAADTHRANKRARDKVIRDEVGVWFKGINLDNSTFEIALAMLYLGEGSKTRRGMALGSSDPKILNFYVNALQRLYGVASESLRPELHLRADQDEHALKEFWSKKLNISVTRFIYVAKDKRTAGRPTYEGYPGVCLISGGGVEIQRRLMYLAEVFCSRI